MEGVRVETEMRTPQGGQRRRGMARVKLMIVVLGMNE
jgi:hypothetical protein